MPFFILLKPFVDDCKKKVAQKPLFYSFGALALFFHISFLCFFSTKPISKMDPKQQKLLVKTHFLPAEYVIKTAKPTPATLQKKTVSSKPKNSVSNAKKKTSRTLSSTKTKQLLDHVQESLAKIETSKEISKGKEMMLVPQSIKELKADQYEITTPIQSEEKLLYQDILISFLKKSLQLPAFGSVKLSMTISKEGRLASLKVLFSDSEINRLFLQEKLETLIYPLFTKELLQSSEQTFELTFCSQ